MLSTIVFSLFMVLIVLQIIMVLQMLYRGRKEHKASMDWYKSMIEEHKKVSEYCEAQLNQPETEESDTNGDKA